VNIAGVMQRFRWIPPGSFMMGSPLEENGRYYDETPHQVNLSQGYWIADTAFIQALLQAVMPNNHSQFKGVNRPVESVSRKDVQHLLQQHNQKHPGLKLCLPSEAEWEYACRSGTPGAFNFEGGLSLTRFNYRGTWDDYDTWGEGALHQTAEVKSFPANAWGLYEMHGNIWEWCQDWYGSYLAQPMTDPNGPDTGADRVLRGGSWYDLGRHCRSNNRRSSSPDGSDSAVGFRLARGHQSAQAGSGADQQPAGTNMAAVRGIQMGDGLRDAGAKPKGIKTGAKKTKGLIDHFKDLFKK
jgi:formylglycine-generating enzyme required for sulfatase activity